MRSLILVGVLVLAPAAFGQHSAVRRSANGLSGPGRSYDPLATGPATQYNPLLPQALPPNSGVRGTRARAYGSAILPYPVYGGGYGGFYQPPPGQYDPIWGIYNPGSGDPSAGYQQTPTVVINQNFQTDTVRPQIRDYSNVPLPPPGPSDSSPVPAAAAPGGDQQPMYLIAMKDHTIYPALAYWFQGGALNYITLNGAKNTVSLDLVDRDFTTKLNDERGVSFKMPMPAPVQ